VVLVVALSVVASWLLLSRPAGSSPVRASTAAATSAAETSAAQSPAAQSASAAATEAAVDLDAALAAAVDAEDGHLAVAVLDTASGTTASVGDDAFVTASIVKVDILAALLHRSGGELTADQRAAAALMIEQSDNDAATALYQAVGQADGLNAANAAFGLTGTAGGDDGYWGLTTTTATDQLRLLQVVFGADSPLDGASQQYLQGLMGQIATDQDWGVSAADQGGDPRLKNGWLPRTTSGLWVVNSIGRVAYDGRELLVAVLSDGSATQQAGIDLVERVASAAAEALTAAADTSTHQ